MYGDQFGEFVCGYWGLKGLNAGFLPVPPTLLSLNLSELSILIASRILLLKSATAAALSCCPLIWSLMTEMIQYIQNLNDHEWNAPMSWRRTVTLPININTHQHRFPITNVRFPTSSTKLKIFPGVHLRFV